MLVKNVSKGDLEYALSLVNKRHGDNIAFKRLDFAGYTRNGLGKWNVTLKPINSRLSGGRLSRHGRVVAACCWHVYGTFIDNLPIKAAIVTGGRVIHPGDEWLDWNIGSEYEPFYYSESCNCCMGENDD